MILRNVFLSKTTKIKCGQIFSHKYFFRYPVLTLLRFRQLRKGIFSSVSCCWSSCSISSILILKNTISVVIWAFSAHFVCFASRNWHKFYEPFSLKSESTVIVFFIKEVRGYSHRRCICLIRYDLKSVILIEIWLDNC